MALLASYSFDEASGDAIDASGNGHDFSLGANGIRATGHTNSAATKSGGSGTLVPLPAGLLAAVNASTSRTLMAWIKGSGATWYVRCNHDDISSGGWGFLNLTGTDIGPRARNAGGLAQFQTAIPAGGAAWYHLAASYDDADDTLRTFVDGVLVDSRALASPLRSDADSLEIMEWGSDTTLLDDLRFFDHAITDEPTIAALMDTPVTAVTEVAGTATGAGGGTGTAAGAPEVPGVATGTGGGTGSASGVNEATGTGSGAGGGVGTAAGVPETLGAAAGSGAGAGAAIGQVEVVGTAAGSGGGIGAATGAVEGDIAGSASGAGGGQGAAAGHQESLGGNGLQVEEITARCESFVRKLAVVESVNGGDIRHMAGGGLHAALFFSDMLPIGVVSGMGAVSVRLEYKIRLYGRLQSEPSDAVDPEMTKAVDAICNAFASQFTLEGVVRNVDVLGAHGEAMRARSGYFPIQEQECRVVDITIPLICNDVWILED